MKYREEGIMLGHADLLNFSPCFSFHAISSLHNLFQCKADQSRIKGRDCMNVYKHQQENTSENLR